MATHPDQTTQDLAHLAFCALIALHTAAQDNVVTSPMAEHLFLIRWLATAQKQKRFTRNVAIDIQLLLDKGRKQGIGAKIKDQIEYLWLSCGGALDVQSDLFRLTHAIEHLKAEGWRNELIDISEWHADTIQGEDLEGSALYVVKSALTSAFTSDGRLIAPIEFLIVGNVQTFVDTLVARSLIANCSGNVVTLSP